MKDELLASLNQSKPRWDSGLGYLFMLDNLIGLACGYGINNQHVEYYNTLEMWYISTIYWFENSKSITKMKVKISEDAKDKEISVLDNLKRLRSSASPSQEKVLKRYHEQLDKLTNVAGLRLGSTESLPGVLKKG